MDMRHMCLNTPFFHLWSYCLISNGRLLEWNRSSQFFSPSMVASVDVLPPVKAARNFEGYDGDVMRPGSVSISPLRRSHAQPMSPYPTIHGSGAIAPSCA